MNGKGKYWDDGSIYVGEFKNNRRTEGKKYRLQPDGTHTLYYVKLDEDEVEIEKKEITKGHKIY
jgi:hypothetical protein